MQRRRTARWVARALIVIGVAIGVSWIMRSYAGPARVYVVVGVAALGLIPVFFLSGFLPAVFSMTCYSKTVDYEFKDAMYALEFEMLNSQIDDIDAA